MSAKVIGHMGKQVFGHEHRLSIVLDTRVALEALLVNALYKSPVARRQEWLRRVLIQGFRAECQGVRAVITANPGTAISTPRLQSSSAPRYCRGDTVVRQTREVLTTSDHHQAKPLAQLRNMIG
jgi:hypothetical protein